MEQQGQTAGVVKQRTVRTEEQILSILEEYDKSGFSVKDYCEVSEINEATFYSWIKKYRKADDDVKGLPAGQAGFATIEVMPTFTSSKSELFAEVGSIKLYKQVSAEYLKALIS